MGRLQVTVEQLSEESLIGVKTIQRMRNDITYNPKLSTIIAICVGLHLQPALSMDLVTKTGYGFKLYLEEHVMYQFIINSMYLSSIHECNEVLRSNDCNTLGRDE